MFLEHLRAKLCGLVIATNTTSGLQQAVKKYLQIDGEYFWKFTKNAFDFDTLFNTSIAFPDRMAPIEN